MLRATGKTYSEIRALCGFGIPKSTLSDWCSHVALPGNYQVSIQDLNLKNLDKARAIAFAFRRVKREIFFKEIKKKNIAIAKRVQDKEVAKIALAMLCLGEASKYHNGKGHFALGNSDYRIVLLFIHLLKVCFDIDFNRLRCGLQCRADQDVKQLEKYWQTITGIPKDHFYKTRIDPRTVGKITQKKEYKGVLSVYYSSSQIQLDLESLADLVYNQVLTGR
ncbi:hypothetical protein C5B42_05645 [Candidatus Cerribacteria bacterium 'Amazon FNV 2010 28 9']|uniref:Uncharacterized protein n=1 Tax=Candidatus Cerribacteria bacterium 'Amazon FNV 2010 28 9' TaxID=2081795 RepID=A0A317JNM5_9BACT|nr:MAG: hypothetical protein C5B42_05645 [Candidatus Cerribacteria bacterium 'Amazon FNV 2010 28 9']